MTIFLIVMNIFIIYIIVKENNYRRQPQIEVLIGLKESRIFTIIWGVGLFIIGTYSSFKKMMINPSIILQLNNILLILICIEGIVGVIITPKNKFGIVHDGIYYYRTLYKWSNIKTYEFVGGNRLDVWIKTDKDYIIKFRYKAYKMEELKEIIRTNVVIDESYKF